MTADHQLDLVSQLANEAVQEKQAEADRVRRDAVLLGLMSTSDGRRHQWDELVRNGFFSKAEKLNGFVEMDTHRVLYALGGRDKAIEQVQLLISACPDLFGEMFKEAMSRVIAGRTKQ